MMMVVVLSFRHVFRARAAYVKLEEAEEVFLRLW